jgi:hypothetical protein
VKNVGVNSVGFVSVAMSEVARFQHKQLQTVTITQNYVPGLLLGHMARHIEYKKRGVGILMRDWVINHALSQIDALLRRNGYMSCALRRK